MLVTSGCTSECEKSEASHNDARSVTERMPIPSIIGRISQETSEILTTTSDYVYRVTLSTTIGGSISSVIKRMNDNRAAILNCALDETPIKPRSDAEGRMTGLNDHGDILPESLVWLNPVRLHPSDNFMLHDTSVGVTLCSTHR